MAPELAATLDPQLRGILEMLAANGMGTLGGAGVDTVRAQFRLLTVDMRNPASVVPVAAVEEIELPGPAGRLRARVYRPEADGPVPTLVFFHGGGFAIGDLDTHDGQCRILCRDVRAVVLSVEYRLAPEHPCPAAVDDCEAATRWAAEHVASLGGDPEAIAVGGDSAGGNLAAVVAQTCRDGGGPRLAAQLLIYPATDFEPGGEDRYPSQRDNAEGYFLTAADMAWFEGMYTAGADPASPRLTPLRGNLEGVAPAVVVTAEFDPLRDQGDAYAGALVDAGVPVFHRSYDGLIHGFFGFGAASPACQAAVDETCGALNDLLVA